VLLGGNISQLERRDLGRFPIDILDGVVGYELKTKQNISFKDIPNYIKEYYPEMVKNKEIKQIWWLIFFQERADQTDQVKQADQTDGKKDKPVLCKYYLTIVEIRTATLTSSNVDFERIRKEAMGLVQKLDKKVKKLDNMDDGIFALVKNFIIVEKLREEKGVLEEKANFFESKSQELESTNQQLKTTSEQIKFKNEQLEVRIAELEKELKKVKKDSTSNKG
jgi:hypothetical protein